MSGRWSSQYSPSAAWWIIKRHVAVDLESSCRVDTCEFAADSGETWNLFWLEDNQTARGKTQVRCFMSWEQETALGRALQTGQKAEPQRGVTVVKCLSKHRSVNLMPIKYVSARLFLLGTQRAEELQLFQLYVYLLSILITESQKCNK